MSKSFLEGVKTPFANLVETYKVRDRDGNEKELAYLPWPRALALAERPKQEVQYFHEVPYFEIFSGAVVAVAQPVILEDGTEFMQQTFLPILDHRNVPIPITRVDPRDVTDTLNRCRAKSAAMTGGVGLALYSEGMRDVIQFLKKLGIAPNTDLSTVAPRIIDKDQKNGVYIDWACAIGAARITDPYFRWEVLWHKVVDKQTGVEARLPVMNCGTGWAVAVKVTYRGASHTEILPIMGMQIVETGKGQKMMDHQPILNPTAHDWNRAVMRCLVKGIAVHTGYGLSVYAKEDVESLHVDPVLRKQDPAGAATQTGNDAGNGNATGVPQVSQEERSMLLRTLADGLKTTKRDVPGLLTWLNTAATGLEGLSIPEIERSLTALGITRPTMPSSQMTQ